MVHKTKTHWLNVVDNYVEGVLSNKITAGSLLKSAVERYVNDIENAQERGFILDVEIAEKMLSSWPILFQHTTGEYAGDPFIPCPWQAFVLWNLFGWREKETGYRRFRTAYVSVARGNGKSPLGASILLTLLAADVPLEVNASCYCAATTKEQATIVYREAQRMVNANPQLKSLINVQERQLIVFEDGSTLKPLASDGKNVHGLVIHGVVIDELHAWKMQHRTLMEAVETALGKRTQPLLVTITTAGDTESELWRESYDYAKNVSTGLIESDRHFSAIYEIDEEDDPLDPACWSKANPMLEHGVVKQSYLEAAADKARFAPETRLSFCRYHCNRQVDSTHQVISSELWAMGDTEIPDVGKTPCFMGFDWGWRDDLSALARVFPFDAVEIQGEKKRLWAIEVDVWTPRLCPRNLEYEPWASWIRDGYLRVTEGDTTDTLAIEHRILELKKKHRIAGLFFDGNNCREFGSKCVNQWRIDAIPVGQSGAQYHEPLQELLAALREGRVRHGGNPLLTWAALNMVTRTKTGVSDYIYPTKRYSKDKIDPIIAVIMAIGAAMHSKKSRQSVYENKGIKMLGA